MSLRNEIAEAAAEILEPQLQFYRRDPSDTNRYFVGPEVLKTIAWVATGVALPILLCAVNEVVKERVKEWLRKRNEKGGAALEPPESIQKEIAVILESRGGIAIPSDQVAEAVNAVSEYLSYRGWPKALAKSDASHIVEAIRLRVAGKP